MEITRTVTVDRPVDEVFDYLSDFTTTNEWDPGTVRTTRESGDGGVGTRYRNVSTFLGRQTELTYVTVEHDPPRQVVLRGENATVVARDTMTVTPTATGTQVSYRAQLQLKGWARIATPVVAVAFGRLADKAVVSLRSALSPRVVGDR